MPHVGAQWLRQRDLGALDARDARATLLKGSSAFGLLS